MQWHVESVTSQNFAGSTAGMSSNALFLAKHEGQHAAGGGNQSLLLHQEI